MVQIKLQFLFVCLKCKKLENLQQESEKLHNDLQTMLENAEFSDVTFVVGGKEFQLHKNILAVRSPVFTAMLKNDFEEKKLGRVELPDLSVEVFDELLRYIYCGLIPNLDKFGWEMFEAADKVS